MSSLKDLLGKMGQGRVSGRLELGADCLLCLEQFVEPFNTGEGDVHPICFDSKLLMSVRDRDSVARMLMSLNDVENVIERLSVMRDRMKSTQAALDEKFPQPVCEETEEDAE